MLLLGGRCHAAAFANCSGQRQPCESECCHCNVKLRKCTACDQHFSPDAAGVCRPVRMPGCLPPACCGAAGVPSVVVQTTLLCTLPACVAAPGRPPVSPLRPKACHLQCPPGCLTCRPDDGRCYSCGFTPDFKYPMYLNASTHACQPCLLNPTSTYCTACDGTGRCTNCQADDFITGATTNWFLVGGRCIRQAGGGRAPLPASGAGCTSSG